MHGLTIFNHSFRQITGNLSMAIRVSLWLVLFYIALGAAVYLLAPGYVDYVLSLGMEPDSLEYIPEALTIFLLVLLVVIVVSLWGATVIAIVWHRYILLEEMPEGFIPYRREFAVGRYFWTGFLISLMLMIVMGILGSFLGMIFGPAMMGTLAASAENEVGAGFTLAVMGFSLVLNVIAIVLYSRMGLVLPAVALGERLTIGQAWEQSGPYMLPIFVLALALSALAFFVPLLLDMLFLEMVGLRLALTLAFNWFFFMLNISVLSTLYGHIIEKREVH